MVKAIKVIKSGCGQFIHASMGISSQGTEFIDVKELSSNASFVVYPNPTDGQVRLRSDKTIVSVRVLSPNGSIISQVDANGKELEFSLKNLTNGIYYLEVEHADGEYSFSKVVLSK